MADYCGYIGTADLAEVSGIQAQITTSTAILPEGNEEVSSVVWIGLTVPGEKWAQLGYSVYREEGGEPRLEIYWEVQSSAAVYQRLYYPMPAGESHTYKAELDAATGTWCFYVDGALLAPNGTYQQDRWINVTVMRATFTGEVTREDVPIVGTEDDPCDFDACQVRVGGAYTNVSFNDGEYEGIEETGTLITANDDEPLFAIYGAE